MKFHLSCSMCGKEQEFEVEMAGYGPREVLNRSLITSLRDAVQGTQWRFEANGENVDTYCCRACAK